MNILVHIDGSEYSQRALRFSIKVGDRSDATGQVIPVPDHMTESTKQLLERPKQILAEDGIPDDPEVDVEMKRFVAPVSSAKTYFGPSRKANTTTS